MVTVGEHAAAPGPQLVERLGDADQQALQAAGQGQPALGLADQVQVVVQHRVFTLVAQAGQAAPQLEGDVHWEALGERGAGAVVDAGVAGQVGLATGTGPGAAPAWAERQQGGGGLGPRPACLGPIRLGLPHRRPLPGNRRHRLRRYSGKQSGRQAGGAGG